MFLLDTNIVSEMRKIGDQRMDDNVLAWLKSVDAAATFISAITVMELEIGVARLERRDVVQGRRLRVWMDERVLPEFEGRTLSIDTSVALRCAHLHVPDPRSERDALIAATALVHGMTLITRNARDFEATGVGIVNPWTGVG